jgi:hypothetical protein
MINSRYTFTLDMHSTISQVSLPVRQFDDSIELRITLTSGGTPYYIENGCRAVFVGRRSNDEPLLNDCRIEKNTTIYYKLTEQTTGVEGVVDCEIRLYGTDNNVLTSPRFILVVNNRVAKTSDFESKIETDALDNIFKNETARQDAERQREIAEAEREVTYNEMLDTVREASEVADILSEKLATGDYNGLTPHIGANGNWWIGDEDTGVLADGYSIPLREGSGKNSVEQIGCEAREENSVALGEGTTASARGQFVAGRYNKENPNALFQVGNGTSDTARSNAFEVLKDGTLVGDGVLHMVKGTSTPVITSKFYSDDDYRTETGSLAYGVSQNTATHQMVFDFTPRVLILLTETLAGYQLYDGWCGGFLSGSKEYITHQSTIINKESGEKVTLYNGYICYFENNVVTLLDKKSGASPAAVETKTIHYIALG